MLQNKIARFFKMLLTIIVVIKTVNTQAQEKSIEWYTKQAPFNMPTITVPVFPNKEFIITDYGAIGDGQTVNSPAFEKAITACNVAGGGKVIVPSGLWLTGPIQLKSNVNLVLQKGALVIFSKDHTLYPMIKASSTSTNFVTASPIYGYDLKNIAITGEGILDGGGDTWRPVKKGKTTEAQWAELLKSGVVSKDGKLWWPTKEAMEGENILKQIKQKGSKPTADDFLPARDFLRPNMISFSNCDNLLIQQVTIRNSPKFIFYPSHCSNLTLNGVNFFNEWYAQNGDAIDISACQKVVIYKCTVSAGDDGICMKSSRGKEEASSTFNLREILVAGCTVYHAHGGFVIGSNTDGGMKNIFVTDCNFIGTDVGIRVKSNKGRGGKVQDIYLNNIFMKDIVNEAILFDTYYEDQQAGKSKDSVAKSDNDKIPDFNNFHISNVYCNGASTAVYINGLPGYPVSKIFFNHVIITADKGFIATDAGGLELNAVKIITHEEPVYNLRSVRQFHLADGYHPDTSKLFILTDKECADISINGQTEK